jgi:hypothetical protein
MKTTKKKSARAATFASVVAFRDEDKCPFCKTEGQMSFQTPEVSEGDTVYQSVTCMECLAEFDSVFRFVGIVPANLNHLHTYVADTVPATERD